MSSNGHREAGDQVAEETRETFADAYREGDTTAEALLDAADEQADRVGRGALKALAGLAALGGLALALLVRRRTRG